MFSFGRRVYQQMEPLGLMLFNDALVVTTRTNSHVPFERCVEHIYTFDTCVVLTRLRLEDIPDSKCQYRQYIQYKLFGQKNRCHHLEQLDVFSREFVPRLLESCDGAVTKSAQNGEHSVEVSTRSTVVCPSTNQQYSINIHH